MNYKWKAKSMQRADPKKVGLELEKLRLKKKGFIQPKDVVEQAAKSNKSELYKCFEWNDKKAADKYRIEQAGLIIRAIVKVVEIDDETVEVKCFESVRMEVDNKITPFYVAIADVLSNKDMSAQVFGDMQDSIDELRTKFELYGKFITGGRKAIGLLNQVKRVIRVKKPKRKTA